jgi:hypothetical protein
MLAIPLLALRNLGGEEGDHIQRQDWETQQAYWSLTTISWTSIIYFH